METQYRVIGLMSGSSLDGIDLAYCVFCKSDTGWTFSLKYTDCIEWDEPIQQELKRATQLSGKELWYLHSRLGKYFGDKINVFVSRYALHQQVDFIASHGHTVFHFPEQQFTTQIGDGAQIAAVTGIPTIVDFRSKDIALYGSGAPVVPIGEKFLFQRNKLFLNIGGIANVSYHSNDSVIGFDVCCANQLLNYLAGKMDKPYDEYGAIAASGTVRQDLLLQLNAVTFFALPFPKSLDNGFSSNEMIPIIDSYSYSIADKLATCCEHIAMQLNTSLQFVQDKSEAIFTTGGGAFNRYLQQRIEAQTNRKVVVPSAEIVNYKEALIIAFMGVLRWRNEINVLQTVTGAKADSVNGAIYY